MWSESNCEKVKIGKMVRSNQNSIALRMVVSSIQRIEKEKVMLKEDLKRIGLME